LPAFAGIDLSSLSKPLVAPEAFLSQCTAVITACWQQMDNGGYATVESLLPEYIPTLHNLTTQSKYQDEAAALLSQAKIMQVKLATRDRNFARRKTLCLEAVQFGELSGDPFLYASALFWYGDTYVYCYPQPEKAIDIFTKGLKHLNSDSRLNSGSLSMNMALACAQQGDETRALNYVEQAVRTMPKYPEQDPAYPYVDITQGNLDKLTGRMYLALAKHLPSYTQKAYNAFEEGIGKFSSNQAYLSQTLIYRADASIYIGDLHKYVESLSDGMRIAIQVNSKNRKHEARTVLDKAPDKWKQEDKYQKLAKMF
jgi:tetratricopeptide (TPR) repeat protein